MDKRRCYQHTRTEMLAGEEHGGRHLEPLDLLCCYREAGTK